MHYASKTAAASRGIPAIGLHPPESQWVFRSSAISCINSKSGRWREPPIQSLPCRTGHRPDLFVSNGIRSKKKRRSLDLSKSVWQFFRKNSARKLEKPSECVIMFRSWSYIHPGGGRSQPNNQIVGEKMYPGAKKVSIFSKNPCRRYVYLRFGV